QGTTLIFQAKATDTDSWQTLTYQFSSAVPDYITMQSATGIISISNKAPAGTLNFNVLVKDNGTPSQSAQIPVSVTVNPLPPPPIVQPISIVAIKTKTGQVTSINITFSDAINATSATKIANYKLISSAGKDKKYYTKDDILLKIGSVKYNAATRTITIVPSAKLVPTTLTNIRLIASGLFDNLGQAVDGNRDKLAGGDLLATLTKSSIVLI
ncbi:MAG: cadherin repeat domain-containing protein, partial [Planctomycetota bacterium]|nr:cadherin repeat domain-containing protein [Planctomycetota bacterium]